MGKSGRVGQLESEEGAEVAGGKQGLCTCVVTVEVGACNDGSESSSETSSDMNSVRFCT